MPEYSAYRSGAKASSLVNPRRGADVSVLSEFKLVEDVRRFSVVFHHNQGKSGDTVYNFFGDCQALNRARCVGPDQRDDLTTRRIIDLPSKTNLVYSSTKHCPVLALQTIKFPVVEPPLTKSSGRKEMVRRGINVNRSVLFPHDRTIGLEEKRR